MNLAVLVPGAVLLAVGMMVALNPESILKLQIWTQKVIMGAEFKPSARTKTIYRIIGLVLIIFGLVALVIVIMTLL